MLESEVAHLRGGRTDENDPAASQASAKSAFSLKNP
jgi:hypothetical protein